VTSEALKIVFDFLESLLERRRHPAERVVLYALGGFAGLIGAVFLVVAADLALARYLSLPAATAVVGGVLLTGSLFAVLLARRVGHRSPRRKSADPLPIGGLADLLAELSGDIEATVKASPATATATAFAVGCAVGCSPVLQRWLLRGLGDPLR
jgi:hypothetical protein